MFELSPEEQEKAIRVEKSIIQPKDRIYLNVTMEFSWWDRIKILLKGEARLSALIDTEKTPGMTWATSEVWVPDLIYWNKGGEEGVWEAPSDDRTAATDS